MCRRKRKNVDGITESSMSKVHHGAIASDNEKKIQ